MGCIQLYDFKGSGVLEILFKLSVNWITQEYFSKFLHFLGDDLYRQYLGHIWRIVQKISPEEFIAKFGQCHKSIIKDDGSSGSSKYGNLIERLVITAAGDQLYHLIVKFIISNIQVTDSAKIGIMYNLIDNRSYDMIRIMSAGSKKCDKMIYFITFLRLLQRRILGSKSPKPAENTIKMYHFI